MRSKGYSKRTRRGDLVWVVDFWWMDANGVWNRFRRDAEMQSAAGARGEADRRRLVALTTGNPEGIEKTPETTIPTFDEFWETFSKTYLVTDYTPATAERYRSLFRQVSNAFGPMRLHEFTLLDWKQFEAALKKRKRKRGDGTTTIGVKARPFAAFLRTLFQKAVALSVLRKDQVPAIPLPPKPAKLPDAPTEEELAAWLAVRPTKWITVAVFLAAFLGARMGEVRELRRGDFDLRNGVVKIRRALSANEVSTTKGKKERQIPLHPSLREALRPLLGRLAPHELLVRNGAGKSPSRQAVLTAFQLLCAKAGTRVWSFHSIRHFFVTMLLQKGGSAIAVQQLAGHEKLETTEGYAHGATASQRRDTILLLPAVASNVGIADAMGNGKETAPTTEDGGAMRGR